jgi:hypothetical protein
VFVGIYDRVEPLWAAGIRRERVFECLVRGGGDLRHAEPVEEEDVRAERDEIEQAARDNGRESADAHRDERKHQHPTIGGEVSQGMGIDRRGKRCVVRR